MASRKLTEEKADAIARKESIREALVPAPVAYYVDASWKQVTPDRTRS